MVAHSLLLALNYPEINISGYLECDSEEQYNEPDYGNLSINRYVWAYFH